MACCVICCPGFVSGFPKTATSAIAGWVKIRASRSEGATWRSESIYVILHIAIQLPGHGEFLYISNTSHPQPVFGLPTTSTSAISRQVRREPLALIGNLKSNYLCVLYLQYFVPNTNVAENYIFSLSPHRNTGYYLIYSILYLVVYFSLSTSQKHW